MLNSRQYKATMRNCITALGDYAALVAIDTRNKSKANELRDLVHIMASISGLDEGAGAKTAEEVMQEYDDKVDDALHGGLVDVDTFDACGDALTGLALHGETLMDTHDDDSFTLHEILPIADLLEEIVDYYDVELEKDFAYTSARWLREYVTDKLNDYDLPGNAIEGLENTKYTIKQAVLYDTDEGFAFAHNPDAASPYVTWSMSNNDKDELNFEIGKYFQTKEKALADYIVRAERYAERFSLKEKPIPSLSQEEEVWRTYKAEIEIPGEEYYHLEVFSADDDVDAVRQANELAAEGEGHILREVHELDENYDSIREIDLRFHEPEARRFMDVDIIDFLGKIADKTIQHYPQDFKVDVDRLWTEAIKENPSVERLMWHCSSYGTHILPEDEVFIKGTGAHGYWCDYRPNEPSMVGYVIEVTRHRDETVVGNVFDVGNYANHAQYVRENSLVMDAVSLTYANTWGINAGKTVTVPRYEYDENRHRLMSESGDVVKIKYHASESVQTMADRLQREKANHMAMPVGDIKEHLKKLVEKLATVAGYEMQVVNDGLRIYHADYAVRNNEHRMEIIAAKDDWEAMKLAFDICKEEDVIFLANLNEIDENANERSVGLSQFLVEIMPDPSITTAERNAYGYDYDGMLPLNQDCAMDLYMQDNEVFLLFNDNSESLVEDSSQITEHDGIFGIERETWQKSDARADMAQEKVHDKNTSANNAPAQSETTKQAENSTPKNEPSKKKKNPYHDGR